ncbi:MAG: hypothetical protein ACYCSP_05990 [Acidobacteriaceae bacterium]
MSMERELILTKRRRGILLKLVRQGHEAQLSRMDDFEVFAILQELGHSMGRDQVLTMLQDLQLLGYLNFRQKVNDITGRVELSEIELTATGLGVVLRRKSNDDVLVD